MRRVEERLMRIEEEGNGGVSVECVVEVNDEVSRVLEEGLGSVEELSFVVDRGVWGGVIGVELSVFVVFVGVEGDIDVGEGRAGRTSGRGWLMGRRWVSGEDGRRVNEGRGKRLGRGSKWRSFLERVKLPLGLVARDGIFLLVVHERLFLLFLRNLSLSPERLDRFFLRSRRKFVGRTVLGRIILDEGFLLIRRRLRGGNVFEAPRGRRRGRSGRWWAGNGREWLLEGGRMMILAHIGHLVGKGTVLGFVEEIVLLRPFDFLLLLLCISIVADLILVHDLRIPSLLDVVIFGTRSDDLQQFLFLNLNFHELLHRLHNLDFCPLHYSHDLHAVIRLSLDHLLDSVGGLLPHLLWLLVFLLARVAERPILEREGIETWRREVNRVLSRGSRVRLRWRGKWDERMRVCCWRGSMTGGLSGRRSTRGWWGLVIGGVIEMSRLKRKPREGVRSQ
jgi:hypothetical protein